MALIGRRSGNMIRMGDRATVEVVHVDVDRRELNFKMISHIQKLKSDRQRRKPQRKKANLLETAKEASRIVKVTRRRQHPEVRESQIQRRSEAKVKTAS